MLHRKFTFGGKLLVYTVAKTGFRMHLMGDQWVTSCRRCPRPSPPSMGAKAPSAAEHTATWQ